jgi:hypothetical protein
VKLISTYTETHRVFKDEWFLPSLKDDYEIDVRYCRTSRGGRYLSRDWTDAVIFKSETIIDTIKNLWGGVFVYSDVDIQFFKPTKQILLQAIENNDIVCQRDDPEGHLCTGFWVARANRKVLKLWENVRKRIRTVGRDQIVFNKFLRRGPRYKLLYTIKNLTGVCTYGYLPETFYTEGNVEGKHWEPGMDLTIPDDVVLHHANWTESVESKIAQLEYVRNVVHSRKG